MAASKVKSSLPPPSVESSFSSSGSSSVEGFTFHLSPPFTAAIIYAKLPPAPCNASKNFGLSFSWLIRLDPF